MKKIMKYLAMPLSITLLTAFAIPTTQAAIQGGTTPAATTKGELTTGTVQHVKHLRTYKHHGKWKSGGKMMQGEYRHHGRDGKCFWRHGMKYCPSMGCHWKHGKKFCKRV